MSLVIAIDGPAGSGKGTITKVLAERLGLVNIDTGAMYRCVALACINNGVTLDEETKVIDLSKKVKIEFDKDGHTFLDGKDVSKRIRDKDVSSIVSPLSSIVAVREEMVKQQRKLAEGLDVIMEGRDITTVVFPNADFKFYLDATVEERAKEIATFIRNNYGKYDNVPVKVKAEQFKFSNNDLDTDMELHSLVLKELNEKMYGADSFEDYMSIVDATEKKQSGEMQNVDYYSNDKRWNRSR